MMDKRKKLILFDIDGTLIYHVGLKTGKRIRPVGYHFIQAAKELFHVDTTFDLTAHNGSVDRKIVWDMVKDNGVSREVFEQEFPKVAPHIHASIVESSEEHPEYRLYDVPPGVRELLEILVHDIRFDIGVLTGNVERVGWWKLEYVDLRKYFQFGVFGDEADDRILLAQSIFNKAESFFQRKFQPEDIVIVGDTIHDIRCGKAVGASTIVVTTGFHNDTSLFVKENPDVIADSFMDKPVLDFLSLNPKCSTIE